MNFVYSFFSLKHFFYLLPRLYYPDITKMKTLRIIRSLLYETIYLISIIECPLKIGEMFSLKIFALYDWLKFRPRHYPAANLPRIFYALETRSAWICKAPNFRISKHLMAKFSSCAPYYYCYKILFIMPEKNVDTLSMFRI